VGESSAPQSATSAQCAGSAHCSLQRAACSLQLAAGRPAPGRPPRGSNMRPARPMRPPRCARLAPPADICAQHRLGHLWECARTRPAILDGPRLGGGPAVRGGPSFRSEQCWRAAGLRLAGQQIVWAAGCRLGPAAACQLSFGNERRAASVPQVSLA